MSLDAALRLQPDPTRYTLPAFLEDVAERHGPRVALRFGNDALTYRELARRAHEVATDLLARGVQPGEHVGVLLTNRPQWATAAFGAALVGAVVVPISTFASEDELDSIVQHADVSTLFMQEQVLGRPIRSKAIERLSDLGRAIVVDRRAHSHGGSDDEVRVRAAAVRPDDVGVIVYTSGSTDHPKGVVHYQRAPVIQSWRAAEFYDIGPDDVILSAQPLFWSAGMAMSLGGALAAGATLVLMERFAPAEALERIERHRVTMVFSWPHQEKAMGEHPSARDRDLSSLTKHNVDSPLAAAAGITGDTWGTRATYGLTETFTLAAGVPASASAEQRRRGRGKPMPGTEIRIVDPETGAPVPPGEHGEIAVRGITLMRGYHGVPPEDVFDADGFFHTRDGGRVDAEGTLHWTGRLSSMIKTGGANVSPVEVEAKARAYPGLEAAFVAGVPHPTLGEVVVLCAIPADGTDPAADDVRAWLRQRLAPYEVPRAVLFFRPDELAFTGTAKVAPQVLREAALARLAADHVEIAGHRY